MPFKAAIFDLDGTLLDTLEDIASSANRVLAELGFPVHPLRAYRTFVGDGVRKLILRVLPADHRGGETVTACVEAFRVVYRDNWNVKTRPYEGVAKMLDGFRDRGVRMSVLSNKPDDFTRACVSGFLSEWTFDIVRGAIDGVPRKPDPTGAKTIARDMNVQPAEVIYLGDTGTDMKTATGAGMFAVGVLWGFRSENELLENGAQVVVEHPRDVLQLL